MNFVVKAISWSSKKQNSLSTTEAEYAALLSAAQECIWLKQLKDVLGSATECPSLIRT